MRRLVLLLVVSFTIACSFGQKPTNSPQEIVITEPPPDWLETVAAQAIQTQIGPVQATVIPVIAKPTLMPTPENTPTPLPPDPVTIEGSGSTVMNIPLQYMVLDYFYVDIEEQSNGIFLVKSFDLDGNELKSEVISIDNYVGRIIRLQASKRAVKFEITCEGTWKFTFLPLEIEYSHIADVPGNYNGNGDDVVWFKDSAGEVLFNVPGDGIFIVHNVITMGSNLFVAETSPYTGRKILPKGSNLFIIRADGPWSAEFFQR